MSFQPVSFRVQANDTSPVEVIWKFDNSAAVTCENCVPFRGTHKNPVDVDFERLPDSGSGDSWTRTNGLTALRLFGQVRNTHLASLSLAILVYSPRFRLASSRTAGASGPHSNRCERCALPMQYGYRYRDTISCGFSRLCVFSDLLIKVKEGQKSYGLGDGFRFMLTSSYIRNRTIR